MDCTCVSLHVYSLMTLWHLYAHPRFTQSIGNKTIDEHLSIENGLCRGLNFTCVCFQLHVIWADGFDDICSVSDRCNSTEENENWRIGKMKQTQHVFI